MICHLCRKDADLQNSHIFPEFFYTEMYDEKHRFFLLSSDPMKKEQFVQKGLREELLCHECERLFSGWEDYGRRVLYGGIEIQSAQGDGALYLKDLDFPKFRLFQLSLLWRMGISKLKFFEQVQLGPYEEKIRQMLLALEPGDADSLPCSIVGVLFEGRPGNWFLPPERVMHKGKHCYRAIIGGFLFIFTVSKKKAPNQAMELFIKKDGSMTVPVQDISRIPFLRNICLELGKAIHERPEHLKRLK